MADPAAWIRVGFKTLQFTQRERQCENNLLAVAQGQIEQISPIPHFQTAGVRRAFSHNAPQVFGLKKQSNIQWWKLRLN